MISLLGVKISEMFTVFFDNIPKAAYFFYACLASALDALQSLMRRLAGLDVYYEASGAVVEKTDPVLSFIYGILGIGEGAGQYSALTTTFWSLAIFGIIVLAVGSIIAIVRSHYQEDSAKTNPMQYIYTAVKSIFTFAIVPIAVVIGLQLSSFMLTTLDNITAGVTTEETIKGVYGTQAVEKFEKADGSYSNYDFFSLGMPSNTTTFSGLLFKAAAYNCNRVRISPERLSNGVFAGQDMLGIFAQSDSPGYTAASDKAAYLAEQIDYAFANNLKLQNKVSLQSVKPDYLSSWSAGDFFFQMGNFQHFSKYNTHLVWYYYNLWQFNFIIGYAAVFTCFGMFISIIVGLMGRLIKSVALFLIYPATLGLASMDDFGAFKKWRGEFIKQILAAFGSIIGMNLFFLLMPFLSSISFYPASFGVLNALVNTIIVITGLVVVKSFIEFVSGLVGGGNVLSEGESNKGAVGKTFMKGAVGAVTGGRLGGKFNPITKLAKFGVKKGVAKLGYTMNQHRADKRNREADELLNSEEATKAREDFSTAVADNQNMQEEYRDRMKNDAYLQKQFNERKANFMAQGQSEEEAEKSAMDEYFSQDERYKKNKETIKNYNEGNFKGAEDNLKAIKLKEEAKIYTERQERIGAANYLSKDGNVFKGNISGLAANAKNAAKETAGAFFGAFTKTIKELGLNTGGLKGLFLAGTNKKVDENGNVTGEVISIKAWDPNKGTETKSIKETFSPSNIKRALSSSLDSLIFMMGNNKETKSKDSVEKIQENAAKSMAESSDKTTKAVENLEKKFDKLIDSLGDGIVKK